MNRRVTGAALNARVVRRLRDMLASDYGLPMDAYVTRDVWRHSIGSDMQPILSVIFRHSVTGAEITVDNIFPGNGGSLDQFSGPVLG